MVLCSLSYKNSISWLVESQALMDSAIQINHLLYIIIINISICFYICWYLLLHFFSHLWVHYEIIKNHHCRMGSSVCTSYIQSTKIKHNICNELWSFLLLLYWWVYFTYIVLFQTFSLFYLVYSVLDKISCKLFILLNQMSYFSIFLS